MSKYFIVWIEGLSVRRGEKIKAITPQGIEYTLYMTEAMRFKNKHIPKAIDLMLENGIATWAITNAYTFIGTNYAPTGTIFKG